MGDVIEAGGAFGKVSDMSLVSTTILPFDNQKLIVPNRKIWGDVIKNVTSESTRRVDLTFRISYGDDIERAERALQEIVERNEHVLDDPEPIIKLHKLGDSSVEFFARTNGPTVSNYRDEYLVDESPSSFPEGRRFASRPATTRDLDSGPSTVGDWIHVCPLGHPETRVEVRPPSFHSHPT